LGGSDPPKRRKNNLKEGTGVISMQEINKGKKVCREERTVQKEEEKTLSSSPYTEQN